MAERVVRPAMKAAYLAAVLAVAAPLPAAAQAEAPPLERVTFDEAVRRALERNPTVGQATQAILRAEGLLAQARSVFRPTVDGRVGTTILDDARGFDGNITQPRTQTVFNATLSYPVLAASRWAARNQAADQVGIARISAEDIRRQVALTAAQAYLAVIASQRQLEIALRSRETAQALADYARTRLEAGQGSKLNFIRSSQELAVSQGRVEFDELAKRRAQEALGVAIFADGPVDANGDPELKRAAPPSGDDWLIQRPDVRLFSAQAQAADRAASDVWKLWVPTVSAGFTPQYVTPKGFFEPARTWRALFQMDFPIFDSTIGAEKRIRVAECESARLRLDAVRNEARAELRTADESVMRIERIVAASREAADAANEALRITEIAYRAGATTNIEVVQAQQTA
ncbi:MAG TPA: TolC family protein, partial [Vicinamibacteria bacterium]